MPWNALIVDDMPLAIASLKSELEDFFSDQINIIGTAEGVLDAAKKIKSLSPDLIFLDIEMRDGDGFDLLDIINTNKISVIFTTGSENYALKAFKYAAVDYLLKPVDNEQIKRALSKIEMGSSSGKSHDKKIIALSTQEELRMVETSLIMRLEAEGNYTHVYLSDGKRILISKTLKRFEDQLGDKFVRVHQSHLVNLDYVKSYIKTEGGYLKMKDGSDVPVSVRKKSEVLSLLKSRNK